MEIQQKDNETRNAYVNCFKTAAKQCTFNNNTAAIHIFVEEHWNAHTNAAKIYKKDPQTLSKVIWLVDKFNAAQQLTATMTPSTVSMMSNDDRCFVHKWVILATTALIHSVTDVMNLATLHRTALTRFLHQEHHATNTGLV